MIDPELENLERAEVPVALTCSMKWKMNSNKTELKVGPAIKAIRGGETVQWLMPSARFKLRSEIDHFFEENQLKGRIIFESDVIASLVRSVIDGVGITFLPRLYVAREIREKSVRVIGPKSGYWKYRVWLTCHAQNKEDILIKALASSFKEICHQAMG
jgi:DNA-binding transcriptional LysR family regulator